jgi:outer membrane biogenesis lipoprotein LolB
MKIKKFLVPALAIAVLTGCSQVNMGSSRSKTVATGSAAGGFYENSHTHLYHFA